MTRKTLKQQVEELQNENLAFRKSFEEAIDHGKSLERKIEAVREQLVSCQESKKEILEEAKAELGEAHADNVKLQKTLGSAMNEIARLTAERDRFAVEIARQVTTAKD